MSGVNVMKKFVIMVAMLTISSLALSGCMLNQKTRMIKFSQKCSQYGFKKGTQAFARCMQKEEVNWDRSFQKSIDSLEKWNRDQQRLQQPRMSCESTKFGDTVSTTCR